MLFLILYCTSYYVSHYLLSRQASSLLEQQFYDDFNSQQDVSIDTLRDMLRDHLSKGYTTGKISHTRAG